MAEGALTITAPSDTITLTITGTGSRYPANLFAPCEMALQAGQTTVLLGTSGSGKSTLLRMIAGLEDMPETVQISGLPAATKRAYMTQEVRLLPWFTVERNAGIGSRLRGDPENQSQVSQTLAALGLTRDAHKYPSEISGGMAQRTALARTLLEDADLNLLDEPFAALDAITRRNMQDLVKTHFQGKTVILVTHDPLEAVRLGDAIFVLTQPEPGAPAAFVPFTEPTHDAPMAAERLYESLQAS